MLREDQKFIANLIEPKSKIIDIGCGEGELLSYLAVEKNISGHGIEIEPERVSRAVGQGLSVIQGDADRDLQYYPENGFDYALMILTLQNMKAPKQVLEEALRIAKRVIITIPNFGHVQNSIYLMLNGRMPVTKSLSYQWYDTPNIHFCSIRDFILLADEVDAKIRQQFYVNSCDEIKKFKGKKPRRANLFGRSGIFVLEKK